PLWNTLLSPGHRLEPGVDVRHFLSAGLVELLLTASSSRSLPIMGFDGNHFTGLGSALIAFNSCHFLIPRLSAARIPRSYADIGPGEKGSLSQASPRLSSDVADALAV